MKTATMLFATALTFTLSRPVTVAGEQPSIPAKAIQAMTFFIGDWEAENSQDGKQIGTHVDRRSWAPGKHCLKIDWSGTENRVPWQATAIAGWDAKENALVEYWYTSRGESLMNCYPLDKMKEDAWDGTFRFTTADSRTSQGNCQVTMTPDGYEYVSRWNENGKEAVFKSVTHKVKGKTRSFEPGKVSGSGATPATIPSEAFKIMKYFVGNWEGEDISDGKKLGTNSDERRWAPGEYCLRIEWSGMHDGAAIQCSGICGWDASVKGVVDHWFGTDGSALMNCYPLDKMHEKVWEGTFSYMTADGTISEGDCQFTPMPDEGVWVGHATQNGKDLVFKSVARRMKDK